MTRGDEGRGAGVAAALTEGATGGADEGTTLVAGGAAGTTAAVGKGTAEEAGGAAGPGGGNCWDTPVDEPLVAGDDAVEVLAAAELEDKEEELD